MATIFIGVGGAGVTTVTKIKEIYNRFEYTRVGPETSNVIFAGIDVDKQEQSEKQSIEFIPISVKNPRDVIDTHLKSDEVFKKWWQEGYYPQTPLLPGNAAGRYRFNGRLIFWHNYKLLRERLLVLISKAENIDPNAGGAGHKHCIYLINCLGGGTGSGMFIDLGFLLRDLLTEHPNFQLFSFLFHGNIWERAGYTESNMVSLGALTELERWMEKPDSYDMKYLKEQLPSSNNKFHSLFDMVYIIDEKNLDNKQFIRKGNKSLIEQYMEFGSWLLFVLSLKEIDRDLQNVVSDYGQLDYFDELRKKSSHTDRSLKYGSAAVSIITVPYEEIADWLKGAFVSSFENGFKELNLDDSTELLKNLKIYEQDSNQLSQDLKSLNAFINLTNYTTNIAKNIDSTNNLDVFNDNLSSYELRQLTKIKEHLTNWKEEIDDKLLLKITNFREEVKEIVVKGLEKSLNFKEIVKYLENLKIKLDLQKSKVNKNYNVRNSSSEILNNMNEIIDEIFDFPTNPIKFALKKRKFKTLMDEWLAYSGFKNFNEDTFIYTYISEILFEQLRNFYESLIEIIESDIQLVNSLGEIYLKLIKKYNELKISYQYDKSNIINVEKLKKKDFPLLISVPIYRDDLELVREDLMKDSELIDSLRNSIWVGMNIENRELNGLRDFYDSIYNDISETRGRNRDAIISKGFEYLNEITKNKLDKAFKEKINIHFRIDKALKAYFERKYQEYQNVLDLPEEKSKFLEEFKYQVGEETIGELQNKKLERKNWVMLAIKGFLNTISRLVNPFWSMKNEEEFKAFYYHDRLNQKNPEKSPAIYASSELDLPLEDFVKKEDLNSDEFRIFMLTYSYGCPLYLLNCVKNANYILYNDPSESLCAFNDKRFLNEWKDNIEYNSRFEFNDFLFIMALGFDMIHRTKKGKAKSKSFYYGRNNLGTITDAMNKIKDTYAGQIKDEVKIKLQEEIFIPRVSAEDIIAKYNTLLAEVDKQLSSIEPPKSSGNMTAHDIWEHLKEQVNVKRDSHGDIIQYVGSFYRNTKEDIGTLLQEHTGLVLF